MNRAVRALKSLISLVWILSMVAVFLPVQVGQGFSGPGAIDYSVSTYGINLLEPFQSGLLVSHVVALPVTLENTGSAGDQYSVTCSIEAGGGGWSVSLLASDGQLLAGNCLVGSYLTVPVLSGGSLTIQLRLAAPLEAPIGDYLRVNVTATSTNDPTKTASVLRQAAVSAPFVQNFSDSSAGRRLQISNPKFFFTRAIGPRIEWPNSLAVTNLNDFRYINAWGYGIGTHVNIEYEVMNIRSGYPPSVVQLTDNPDRTVDHSTTLAGASNGITGAAFIRTVSNNLSQQKQNVFFARIDARGLPLGMPEDVTENPYFGTSNAPNVPFFSGVSIRATTNDRFILTWAKQENDRQDIYEAIYDSVSGTQVVAPQPIILSTDTINYASPTLAGLDTSALTFLTYIANEPTNLITPTSIWGVKLDANGAKVGDNIMLAAINGNRIDTVQLWEGNILVAWIDDPSKSPTYGIWDTNGSAVKSPTSLVSPDGLPTSQIAVTYDQYNHGIITWGNLYYSRMYYALVAGNGALLTPPMIQRNAEGATINLGSSIYSTAFLVDPIDWIQHLPLVSK